MPEDKPVYGKRAVTPVGRISFPKWPDTEGRFADGKYKCKLIIPKSDEAASAALFAIVDPLALEVFGESDYVSPIQDGDESDRVEYHGHWVISPRTKRKPKFVDYPDRADIDPDEIRAGDYVRVGVSPYSYSSANGDGISLGLTNVQKIRDGEPFGGGLDADAEFEAAGLVDELDAF